MWPDVAVEEGNLTKGVFSLRQLLDPEDSSRYIETIPKRGYRFGVQVTAGAPTPAGALSGRVSPETPVGNSIAVMPFTPT